MKHLFLPAIMALAALIPARAQEQSPYSMMGFGVLNDHASSTQRSMGGVGYAVSSRGKINVKNPASYAAIDSMTFLFDIGVDAGALISRQDDLSSTKPLGGLDYVTMQVPIGKWMGASIGLLPYSSVGYRFGAEIVNGEAAYQGQGGVSEVYLGWAARPVKGLTAGFNMGYLFGNVINDVYQTAADNGSSSLYERVLKVRDFNAQLGIQYHQNLTRLDRLSLGATYTFGHRFHGQGYGVKYDVSSSSTVKPDTVGFTRLAKRFTMPCTLGVGLAYSHDERLLVGVDFTWQPWSKAKFLGIEGFSAPLQLADRWKAAIGAEFTPAHRGAYHKRMAYRLGAYAGQDYMTIAGNNVKEFGVTCGFGFPTPLRTTINLGLEYRRRVTKPLATVGENYFMVTLGIALNEVWFMPSRIR